MQILSHYHNIFINVFGEMRNFKGSKSVLEGKEERFNGWAVTNKNGKFQICSERPNGASRYANCMDLFLKFINTDPQNYNQPRIEFDNPKPFFNIDPQNYNQPRIESDNLKPQLNNPTRLILCLFQRGKKTWKQ